MTNMRRQKKVLVAMALPSDIPQVNGVFELPSVAKTWRSNDEGELRGSSSSGAALPLKDLAGM